MITASVGVDSSLLLEPARELLFPLPETATSRSRCCLTLSNLSPCNDVVFRVRTRNPDGFTVRPTHGLVAPGTSAQVIISATARTCERLSAMNPNDLMTRQSSELFLVQSVEREEEARSMEPLDPASSSSLRAYWKTVPKDCIAEYKMVCRFTKSESAPPLGYTTDENLFSKSSSGSTNSMEFRSSRSGSNRGFTLEEETIREPRRSRGQSFRTNNDSFTSDASFHTTIEPPIMERASDARMSSASSRVSAARTRQPSAPVMNDTVLTSISVNDSEVTDTMLSAKSSLSTNTTTGEATHEVGPLQYHIQPEDVLSFDVKPASRFWGSSSFFVVNSSQNDCLVFKVRTSNQSGYVVKPSRGLVSTTNAQKVVVSICAPREGQSFDAAKREAKDGFLIEVANISREKYNNLIKLDERNRSREIGSLWSLVPPNDRQSTMLSVELKMEENETNRSSGTRASSVSAESDNQSTSNYRAASCPPEEVPRQTLASVVHGLKTVSMDNTPERSEETNKNPVRGHRRYAYSDSDESAFTIGPTVLETENGSRASNDSGEVVFPRQSAVVIVSADRMDTVDFSNPKLSFFI
ncbi:hypothetical protein PHYBOEH_003245 [Phytophthora boehmeriae]|uniref:MSP domain-containing protein n=1 Tax=Phytophthora boehmeriae TaxID=109152 RepID=A0A8T1XCE0_9STRA|nr:hypothetical protein PHYBOEH_003245 [Phytophthora boehmeriae]